MNTVPPNEENGMNQNLARVLLKISRLLAARPRNISFGID